MAVLTACHSFQAIKFHQLGFVEFDHAYVLNALDLVVLSLQYLQVLYMLHYGHYTNPISQPAARAA